MKHEVSSNEVELILYEDFKKYDNHDYQLLTTGTLDIQKWLKSRDGKFLPLSPFIKRTAQSLSVSEKIEAGIILDYRFLKYQEEFDFLDSTMDDLKYDLENSH